jgi:hydroxyacylglutathione hydrolase
LPDNTQVYPGHDYITNNLGFTVDREPDNDWARGFLRKQQEAGDSCMPYVTNMAWERMVKPFLRLSSQTIAFSTSMRRSFTFQLRK